MPRPARFTLDELLDAAAALLAADGPAAVTMSAVARAAHAPSGSMYHRFPTRAALCGELAQSAGGRPFCHGRSVPITDALSITLGGGWSAGRERWSLLNLNGLVDGLLTGACPAWLAVLDAAAGTDQMSLAGAETDCAATADAARQPARKTIIR